MFTSHSKILIIGTSGAGKTTLAKWLVQKFGLKDIELDELFWKENWTPSNRDEFREKIANAQNQSPGYVMHGNYSQVRDLTWGKAEVVIWLDYSKSVIFRRVLKRSLKRILKQEVLWSGNRESFRKTFFSKDSIILWSIKTYEEKKRQYNDPSLYEKFSHIKLLRFTTPKECSDFFNNFQREL